MIRCSLTTAASIKANTQNVFSLRGRNVWTSLGQGSRIKISDVTSPKRSYSLNTGSIHHHMEGECEQTHVRHPHMNVHVVVFFGSHYKCEAKLSFCALWAFAMSPHFTHTKYTLPGELQYVGWFYLATNCLSDLTGRSSRGYSTM